MYKTKKRIINIVAILTMVCLSNATFAAPILFNETNFDIFYEDTPVTFADDGSSVLMQEDPQL